MGNAIEIRDLKKSFKRHKSMKDALLGKGISTTALNGISMNIREGEIFGLLGPNGAGKTTLIKILTTLILPTEGTALVRGHDIVKDEYRVRNIIGLIHSDERSFFWRLTGRQNLDFFAAIFSIPGRLAKKRVEEVIAHVGLEKQADKLFHDYSTGMKQRLAIARGLLNSPKVLFMDEAMRAIDPISTRTIREFIKTMVSERKDMTIVMATNRLDEAKDLCGRVAILNKGQILKCGSIEEIEAVSRGTIAYEIKVKDLSDEVIGSISRMRWVRECKRTFQTDGRSGIMIKLDSEEESIHLVLREIMDSNGHILSCERKETSFEESFDIIISEAEAHQAGAAR